MLKSSIILIPIIFSVSLSLSSITGGLCESGLGWVNHGNSCYWFGSHHVSWEAARLICQAKGTNADLAVPSDESVAKLLASYAEFYDPLYSWWLGCSQFEVRSSA